MRQTFSTFQSFLSEIDRFEKVVGQTAGTIFCTITRKTLGKWQLTKGGDVIVDWE